VADAEELAVMAVAPAIDGKVVNKYPKILGVTDKRFFKDEEIIENRNKFVEEFGITKSVNVFPYIQSLNKNLFLHNQEGEKPATGVVDHPEMYQTSKSKLILICSNYSDNELPPSELGMTRYANLYAKNCSTYIRIFHPGVWSNMIFWLKKREIVRKKLRIYQDESEDIQNILSQLPMKMLESWR
jgi:hypothetical protein